jgi:hypothetical protein
MLSPQPDPLPPPPCFTLYEIHTPVLGEPGRRLEAELGKSQPKPKDLYATLFRDLSATPFTQI